MRGILKNKYMNYYEKVPCAVSTLRSLRRRANRPAGDRQQRQQPLASAFSNPASVQQHQGEAEGEGGRERDGDRLV